MQFNKCKVINANPYLSLFITTICMQSFRLFNRGLQSNIKISDQGHGQSVPMFSGHLLHVLLPSVWPWGLNTRRRKVLEVLGKHQSSRSEHYGHGVEEVLDARILKASWRWTILVELYKMWMLASRSLSWVFYP